MKKALRPDMSSRQRVSHSFKILYCLFSANSRVCVISNKGVYTVQVFHDSSIKASIKHFTTPFEILTQPELSSHGVTAAADV